MRPTEDSKRCFIDETNKTSYYFYNGRISDGNYFYNIQWEAIMTMIQTVTDYGCEYKYFCLIDNENNNLIFIPLEDVIKNYKEKQDINERGRCLLNLRNRNGRWFWDEAGKYVEHLVL